MKRRFPGETDGPTGGRHFDVRGGRTPNQQGRGWPPMMGRGPPGRFMGPSSAPPIHHPGGRGMPPMFGGGPQGRGLPAPFHGRGPPVRGMARPMDTRGGMRGPHDSFGGRGPPQGRISPGRGIPPPPPPRLNPGQVGGAFPSRPPPHHNTMPPPPMLPGSFSHHHQPTAMLKHVPPPPLRYQHPTQALLPLGTPFRPPAPYAPIAPATTTTAPLAVAHVPTYSGATAISALQPSAVPPPTKPRVPTQLELDAAWSEHTDDKGVIFFHNPFLNESTYTRPTALKKSDGSDSMPVKKQWLEYTDPSSGKKYYSDGSTTTWEKPAELSSSSVTNTDESLTVNEQPKRKKKKAELEDYANKAEAIAGFKGFLLVKGIPPSSKWNDVAKLLSTNPRWEAFAESLSIGERRQALAEYQTKRANDLKNQERQERIRAKEAYGQLLTDVLQSLNGFSTTNPRFSDVRAALAKDDRFHGVADEAARESLFLDFCEELRKREQRQKRSKKREIVDAFNSFLREKEEAGILTFASTW
jgi:pre-mRNA-processing factor 40